MSQSTDIPQGHFLELPAELRNYIYELILPLNKLIIIRWDIRPASPAIARTNQQTRCESFPIFYRRNTLYIAALWKRTSLSKNRLLLPIRVLPKFSDIIIQEYPCEPNTYGLKIEGGVGKFRLWPRDESVLTRHTCLTNTMPVRWDTGKAFIKYLAWQRGPNACFRRQDLEILAGVLQSSESSPRKAMTQIISAYFTSPGHASGLSLKENGVNLPIGLSLPPLSHVLYDLTAQGEFDPLHYWGREDGSYTTIPRTIPYVGGGVEALQTLPRDCTTPEYLLKRYPFYWKEGASGVSGPEDDRPLVPPWWSNRDNRTWLEVLDDHYKDSL
jgi:hypothetical protein